MGKPVFKQIFHALFCFNQELGLENAASHRQVVATVKLFNGIRRIDEQCLHFKDACRPTPNWSVKLFVQFRIDIITSWLEGEPINWPQVNTPKYLRASQIGKISCLTYFISSNIRVLLPGQLNF